MPTKRAELNVRPVLDFDSCCNHWLDFDAMERVGADNEAWITALVREIGWIDVSRFGEKASREEG